MHDLPPETVDEEPLVPFVEEAKETPSSLSNPLDVSETPLSLPPPSSDPATRLDLFMAAQFLHSLYPNGLSWNDLGKLIHQAAAYLSSSVCMDDYDKEDAILAMIEYVIAQTDPQKLPKQVFDARFHDFLAPFIFFVLGKTKLDDIPSPNKEGDDKMFSAFIQGLLFTDAH